MSKGKGCILYPEVTTPDKGVAASRLYKDLIDKKGDFKYPRTLANLLYASYVVSGEKAMEAATNSDGSPKYKKNRQGQFNAKDVVEFFDFDSAIGEFSTLKQEEFRMGATDANGNRVDFTDAEKALSIADNFNNTHKGLVASVVSHDTQNGMIYNIQVYQRTSKTVELPIDARKRLQTWDAYKQAFNAIGIDITSMPQELSSVFSAYNTDLGNQLKNLSKVGIQDIYSQRDAMTLFYLDKDSQEVKNLINSFGSIEDAAQALSDFNNSRISLSTAQQRLLLRAFKHAQKLHGLDIDALTSQIDQIINDNWINSPESEIADEIHRLKKKYGIEIDEINRTNDEIRTLSAATSEAIIQLERRIKELKKQKGITTEYKRLETLLNKMMKELQYKRYYNGIIDYMGEAAKGATEIDNLIHNIPQTGTEKDRIFATMRALQNAKRIRDQYQYIIDALSSDNTAMDEAIAQVDIDKIKQQATNLKSLFEKSDKVINDLTKIAVHDFMRYATNGKMSEAEINDMLNKAAMNDVSWQDKFLYSVGTASNILIAACGSIMRNQEDIRDSAQRTFRKKMDIEDNKLKEAGYNSKFMYEDSTHIVSDIDWKKYESEKQGEKKRLAVQGLKGYDFNQKLEEWIEQHTEDRVVDKTNGRTERVPNQNYRKATNFQEGWSQAQIDYYNNVMQLKGELESMYPDHARNWYLPPQTRRNSVDAITNVKSIKDVGKAVGNKLKDQVIIREDDTNYGNKVIINGEEYTPSTGTPNNYERKEVPIYYQRKVEEGELLMDFSAALLREAKSAINYDAMESIRDVMEFMRDYAAEKTSSTRNPKAEIADNKFMRVTKDLYSWAKKNEVADILNGFIDQHIFGEKKDPGKYPQLTKFFDSVIRYTSFRGLAFNAPGATANALMGVLQVFIDANSNEFFGYKDMLWASSKLFGSTGVGGEIMEIATNNRSHKGTLMQEIFDPMQEQYESDSSKRYHSSLFRKLLAHDCTFIGYSSGEYLIHMIPMYAILHKEKVLLNGEQISLYDALEVSPKQNGNASLQVKAGVTDLKGNPITIDGEYIHSIKGKIRYANQSMHGAMNAEDKGMIHKYIMGRMAMNFRQWMVGHYSRRFRGRHFDFNLGDYREGYYVSFWKALMNNDTKDAWAEGQKKDALMMFMKDLVTFTFRSSTQWSNLTDMQKYNIKRVRGEMLMFILLSGLSFALGDPDDHKKEFWRRWWMYQVRRMLIDTEASMPTPFMLDSFKTIVQSPMASVNTFNSMMYIFWGLQNGDLFDTIKSGDYKGWNRYLRNLLKYVAPLQKDIDNLRNFDEDDSLFKVFEHTPSNR